MVSVPRRGFIVFLQGQKEEVEEAKGLFQSPEGDSLFFYEDVDVIVTTAGDAFQSPEGDSLFFYYCEDPVRETSEQHVSVPRRGFVVFLLGWFFDHSPGGERRFQSPEGDSLFFY